MTAFILAFLLILGPDFVAHAQNADSIWMETGKDTYGASEVITITLKTNVTTPIQGFTFQISYDPACLQVADQTSLLTGLNNLPVPQNAGLVDAIYASSNPLNANGDLVQVNFTALAACQTTIKLENASMAVADASGMAVAVPGISLGASSLELMVGTAADGAAALPTNAPQAEASAINPATNPAVTPETNLTPVTPPARKSLSWLIVPLVIILCIFLLVGLIVTGLFLFRERRKTTQVQFTPANQIPSLNIKRGQQAGTSLALAHFPCRIGNSPENEIFLEDEHIASTHAEILADEHGFTLVDLGSGTYVNGKLIRNQQIALHPGDVLRMGGVIMSFSLA